MELINIKIWQSDVFIHITLESEGYPDETIHLMENHGSDVPSVRSRLFEWLFEVNKPRYKGYSFYSISLLVNEVVEMFAKVLRCECSGMTLTAYRLDDTVMSLKDYLKRSGMSKEDALEELCNEGD